MTWKRKVGDALAHYKAQKAAEAFRARAAQNELARREAAVKAEMARRRRAAGW
jgi:hypothetical protein